MAMLRLTLVVDNQPGSGTIAEHGLSILVETAGSTLLFDTGQGPALAANASALGIDLGRVQAVVLSHGHYDHTGGLPLVLRRAPGARVVAHRQATIARYAVRDGHPREIGMPAHSVAAIERWPAEQMNWTDAPVQFDRAVHVTGAIPRLTGFETTGGPFFLDPEGYRPDPIADDQAMWVATGSGVVVIAGCGHAGLINTLRAVTAQAGGIPLRAVVGGFHLGGADDRTLATTIGHLRAFAPGTVIPCHCTGERAAAELATAFPGRVRAATAGCVFTFD